jgi:hypothetical protein
MGAANSSTAGRAWTEPIRVRKASEVLVDGDLTLGARAAEASGRLPDYNGKTGGAARRVVFLEDGGHWAGGCEADAKEGLRLIVCCVSDFVISAPFLSSVFSSPKLSTT